MATLTYREKLIFEQILGMDSGYVLDFSNAEFARLIGETVNIDIYDGVGYEDYCSKANKLRQIWSNESDHVVGILMEELLSFYEDSYVRKEEELTEAQKNQVNQMRIVIKRLRGSNISVDLPDKPEETLQILMEDINDSLSRNKPTLVLDRLHTFATKLLRQNCIDNGINIKGGNGDFYPLQSLAGMLKKKYENDKIFESTFTLRALQNSISLFDSYNDIRNSKSYAHDNDILNQVEADFVVKAMANVLVFVDNIEKYRKSESARMVAGNQQFELPF